MHLCLYASEVAAAIGDNPYRSPFETLLLVWKRYHQGRHLSSAQKRIAQETGRTIKSMEPEEVQKQAELKAHPRLAQLTRQWTSQVESQPLQTVLDESMPQLPALSAGHLQEYVKDVLSRHYGRHAEQKYLEAEPQIAENNTQFYRCDLGTVKEKSQTVTLALGGRVDGFKEGQLVEIKNRRTKFLTPVPRYDLIQIHCYMHLVKQNQCVLIERLSTGEEKHTHLAFDPELWRHIEEGMRHFCHSWAKVLLSPTWQDRVLTASTKEEKLAVMYTLHSCVESVEKPTSEMSSPP